MNTILTEKNKLNKIEREIELRESAYNAEFIKQINEYRILESHIVYFSAGNSKIKELLIKRDPSYSI